MLSACFIFPHFLLTLPSQRRRATHPTPPQCHSVDQASSGNVAWMWVTLTPSCPVPLNIIWPNGLGWWVRQKDHNPLFKYFTAYLSFFFCFYFSFGTSSLRCLEEKSPNHWERYSLSAAKLPVQKKRAMTDYLLSLESSWIKFIYEEMLCEISPECSSSASNLRFFQENLWDVHLMDFSAAATKTLFSLDFLVIISSIDAKNLPINF